ncbi:MAG: hypothetical protein KF861_22205, partial [Planctomycetaceae bacterium]|nr:hypothetical protein [Planctomycetaceae bacterium]
MSTVMQSEGPSAEMPSSRTPNVAAPLPHHHHLRLQQAVELALLLGVAYLFDVEGRRQFFPVLCLIFSAAIVRTWLPPALRLPFFALTSLTTILLVLEPRASMWVFGIGGGLIGLATVPRHFAVRVSTVIAASIGLIIWRTNDLSPMWVVVGSLFMFRMALFLYETRRARERSPLAQTLSYFFMLPNVCFPLFPVVDYRKFCDTYSDDNEGEVFQRGSEWILRGFVHLLLFRFVKTCLVPQPYEIRDVLAVSVFLATNYALYLQVSGQFHLATGVLHLFGFNLPRTHNCYFLASSVSDIWRRINIYWKDFLEKLVFQPMFFGLRRRGMSAPAAIVVGVMAVFLSTWVLHDWQTYWLLGTFPLKASDALLWLGVGACVAINSLWEYSRAKRPRLIHTHPSWWSDLRLSAQTIGMFAAVSLFWACWTRPQFLSMTGVLLRENREWSRGLLAAPASLAGLVLAGAAFLTLKRVWTARRPQRSLTRQERFQLQALAAAALIAAGLPGFARLFPDRVTLAIEDFRSDLYVQSDPFTELQSYYEDLNTAAVQSSPLLTSLTPQRIHRREIGDRFAALTRRADPLLEIELIPGWTGELDGHRTTINQFGMRDRKSLTLLKPPGTVRIACVGSSVVMGYSTGDEEVFTRLLEERLNTAWAEPAQRFEVLNFGTGRHWALQRRVLVDRKVLAFEPDVLIYFAHQDEAQGPVAQLTRLVHQRIPLPYPFLDDIMAEAEITPETPPGVISVRLSDRGRI